MHRDHIHLVRFIIRTFWSWCQLKFAKAQKISCLQHFHVPFQFLCLFYVIHDTPYTFYFNINNTIFMLFHNSKGYPYIKHACYFITAKGTHTSNMHVISMKIHSWFSIFPCSIIMNGLISYAWLWFSQIKLNIPWL